MQINNNEIAMSGLTSVTSPPMKAAKPANIRENPLKIDDSVFYYLIHTYINTVFHAENRDFNDKVYELEQMAESLGKKINELISVDLLEKFIREKEKQDIKNIEYIKFLCKEFWVYVFGKPIDKLQTNHKGTFFLTDTNFKLLSRINSGKKDETKVYLNFCLQFIKALVKGSLFAFAILAEVSVETNNDIEFQFIIRVREE